MKSRTIRSPRLLPLGIAATVVFAAACKSDSPNEPVRVPASLTAVSGSDAQTGVVGHALTTPITVHVMDQAGAGFGGATVTWTVVGGGGTVDSATTTTSATGDTKVTWTLGTAAGIDSLRAAISTGPSIIITATARADTASTIARVSGDSQNVVVDSTSAPLVVKATDSHGNAVSGATVTWMVTGGSGALSATSSTTAADGTTSVRFTPSGPPGVYVVSATSGAIAAVTFTLTSVATP